MKREMKHYLDLVSISSCVHKKQSRMTRVCILLAVFLISSIFSMADMWIQSQIYQSIQNDGGWHAVFQDLNANQMDMIDSRAEVKECARYAVTNYNLDSGCRIGTKETVVVGFDENLVEMIPGFAAVDGHFPQNEKEAVVTESLRIQQGVQIGDTVLLEIPGGNLSFTVSGFMKTASMLTSSDAFGLVLNMDAYRKYFSEQTAEKDFSFYVQFSPYCRIQKTITSICEQLNIDPDTVGQNTKLLGLLFQSEDSYMVQLYLVAGILAVLVAAAGIFMISGSMNSDIANRVQFFGLLRCLGADRHQVIRFVRREALNWCSRAIPLGLGISVITVWLLCAVLRKLSPLYFETMPLLGVSWIGLAAGIIVGLLTVLLAALAPAKRASRVSPLTAVSGNDGTVAAVKKAATMRVFSVEAALGVHHARGSRRNFLLMTGSFAFSIILFLSFSPAIDFMNHALKPLQPGTADLSVVSSENECSVPQTLVGELKDNPAVKRVYGRRFARQIPVRTQSGAFSQIDLISYEENQFHWAGDALIEGNLEGAVRGEGVLGIFDSQGRMALGERIFMQTPAGEREIEVCGLISDPPFNASENSRIIICSEKLFEKLTGETDYTIIDMQLVPDVKEEDVQAIRELAGEGIRFEDNRMSNSQIRGAYYSFALFFYGFLFIIAMISVFNIINSISMSVAARQKQYGAMRAVGMTAGQVIKMIVWETITYILSGSVTGCVLGLLLHYKLYGMIITSRWGDSWHFPATAIIVILCVTLIAAGAAVWNPARKIRSMSVADTVNEL